ncbi:unnamed protein product [Acanthocheilonema viteae]|uniref:Domain of unknown function DB domain-containing protein n=1 Tax=Acanthocheilonema viteae TaxID=6277 RepID=A0A498SFU8_ACAVI|nr:unnamed protein product [Acanthocheilonema viteae]
MEFSNFIIGPGKEESELDEETEIIPQFLSSSLQLNSISCPSDNVMAMHIGFTLHSAINRSADRKILMFKRSMKQRSDLRRSPNPAFHGHPLPLCGTAELGYKPCTSRGVADKLFQSCCNIYVPKECRSLCVYETNQNATRELLISILRERKCSLEYLSSILYCASQNRDNRKCCTHLNLNDPQLQVGSRCLRMCDPTGTAIEQITMEDATCMYNWNVIMYCHHSGIREM